MTVSYIKPKTKNFKTIWFPPKYFLLEYDVVLTTDMLFTLRRIFLSDSSGRFKKCDQDNTNKLRQQITYEYGLISQRILIFKAQYFR